MLGADFAILFVQIWPNQCVSWPEKVSKQSLYEVGVQNEWDFHFTGAKGKYWTAWKKKYSADMCVGI